MKRPGSLKSMYSFSLNSLWNFIHVSHDSYNQSPHPPRKCLVQLTTHKEKLLRQCARTGRSQIDRTVAFPSPSIPTWRGRAASKLTEGISPD